MQVKMLLATPALIFGETVDSDVSEWRPLPGAPCNESGDNSESVFPPRYVFARGVVGQGRGETASPTFFRQGGRVPHSPTFLTEIRQKLVHCCNWLLTETQCKIISVQQN